MTSTLPVFPPPPPRRSGSGRSAVRCLCAVLLAAYLVPAALHAAPLLRCRIDQGGTRQVLDVRPVADPYTVAATDINGRFRFKAVVIGDERQVDYIKLYVYGTLKRQPVLIHLAHYVAPVAAANPGEAALTGINYVYSPLLERELSYGCALLQSTP
jgi:hypothetical protein